MRSEAVLPAHIETVPEAIAFWAESTPHAPALRDIAGRALSHRALAGAVARAANRLGALGVQRGDYVALILPPSIDAWVALLASMTGAVAIPFTPTSAPHELLRDLGRRLG